VQKLKQFLRTFDAYKGMKHDFATNGLIVQLRTHTAHGQPRPQGDLAKINQAIAKWVYRKRRVLGNTPVKKTARDLIKDLLTVYLKRNMSATPQPGGPPVLTMNVQRIPNPNQRNSGNPPPNAPQDLPWFNNEAQPKVVDGNDPNNTFAAQLLRQLNLQTTVWSLIGNDDHFRSSHSVLTTYYMDNVTTLNPDRHMYTQLNIDDTASVATGTTAVMQQVQQTIG